MEQRAGMTARATGVAPGRGYSPQPSADLLGPSRTWHNQHQHDFSLPSVLEIGVVVVSFY